MRCLACIPVVVLAVAMGCNHPNRPAKMAAKLNEAQVLPIAEKATKAKMPPEHVDQYKPYRAELMGGVWSVFGTLPDGVVGGTPEARVRDSDGKVLEVFHSQ